MIFASFFSFLFIAFCYCSLLLTNVVWAKKKSPLPFNSNSSYANQIFIETFSKWSKQNKKFSCHPVELPVNKSNISNIFKSSVSLLNKIYSQKKLHSLSSLCLSGPLKDPGPFEISLLQEINFSCLVKWQCLVAIEKKLSSQEEEFFEIFQDDLFNNPSLGQHIYKTINSLTIHSNAREKILKRLKILTEPNLVLKTPLLDKDFSLPEDIDSKINFLEENQQDPDLFIKESETILTFGKNMLRAGETAQSHKILEMLLQHESSPEMALQYLIINTKSKNYEKNIEFINSRNLLPTFSFLASDLQFWIAYSFFLYNKKEEASNFFQQIVKYNPLSFYGIVAQLFLTKYYNIPNFFLENEEDKNLEIKNLQFKLSEEFTDFVNALYFLADHPQNYFFTLFLEKLYDLKTNFLSLLVKDPLSPEHFDFVRQKLVLDILSTLAQKNKYLLSFKIGHYFLDKNTLSVGPDFLKIFFPIKYEETIHKYSSKHEMDSAFIKSVVRQESAHDYKATSPAKAKGLLQLLPSTAKTLSKKAGFRRFKSNDLYQPDLNINLGTLFLSDLKKQYKGNIPKILSAYNAGPHRVSQWEKRGIFDHTSLISIELIPFKETRNYIKYILRNYYFYLLQEAKNNPEKLQELNNRFFEILNV